MLIWSNFIIYLINIRCFFTLQMYNSNNNSDDEDDWGYDSVTGMWKGYVSENGDFAGSCENAEKNYAETSYIEIYSGNENTRNNDSLNSLTFEEISLRCENLIESNFEAEEENYFQRIKDNNEPMNFGEKVQLRNLIIWLLNYLINYNFTSRHNGLNKIINLQHCYLNYHSYRYSCDIIVDKFFLKSVTLIFDFERFKKILLDLLIISNFQYRLTRDIIDTHHLFDGTYMFIYKPVYELLKEEGNIKYFETENNLNIYTFLEIPNWNKKQLIKTKYEILLTKIV